MEAERLQCEWLQSIKHIEVYCLQYCFYNQICNCDGAEHSWQQLLSMNETEIIFFTKWYEKKSKCFQTQAVIWAAAVGNK